MGYMINKITFETQTCPTEQIMLDNGWSNQEWEFVENLNDFSNFEEYNRQNLIKTKQNLLNINDNTANFIRYNNEFIVNIQNKDCLFKTNTETQVDIQTALLTLLSGANTYDSWITENGIELNLTLEDIKIISNKFKETSNIYPKWLYYYDKINNCNNIEELNNLTIDYSIGI